jgi:hypothetical protein
MTSVWASLTNGRLSVAARKLEPFARAECSYRSERPPQIPLHVAVAPRVHACRCLLFAVARVCRAWFTKR